ncbi:MAG: septum formation inhibitor Maf [Gammaproteobacteria bacterium]|nr:septum formation inhibitor Maf [Gammaproteobacteria bacterium]MYD75542.1 septum formation inhibitor Maf [Gammaproteobacteria bacterium]MYJ53205.1 septum formation inhibitor Maf [Gammaproteobacteria bacterium]
MNAPLILASTSPRRRTLLGQLGIDFTVADAGVDEFQLDGESPGDMTARLAREKAAAVYRRMGPHVRVLGGDTTVSIAEKALGKPRDHRDAVAMLEQLSGATHAVYSAVTLCDDRGCRSLISRTDVTFRELHADEIERYCLSGDPYDKAGGYGIQSGAAGFVTQIEGSYTGVIGLPLWQTHQLIFSLPARS